MSHRLGQIIILSSLITISLGFIWIFYVLSFYDSSLVRALYFITSLIIGFLFYLTIAGILFQLALIIKLPIPKLQLAQIGVTVSIILFLIGSISASLFKIKTVEIEIDNLPAAWQGKKVVQISDLHLGSINGNNFLRKVSDKVKSLNPDYLIITGDLFDGAPGQVSQIGPNLNLLQAKEKVIFIPGNHDKYLGLDKFSGYLLDANILTLKDEAVNIDDVELIGLDFLTRGNNLSDRKINNLREYSGQVRFLFNHAPTGIEDAKKMGISLQLSGHSHRGQMWPVSILTQIIYGKYHYGLHTEEAYNIYTSSGVGSWGPPLRTFNRPEIVQIILR